MYDIVKDICEGVGDCVNVCPVDCIKEGDGVNTKGTIYFFIEDTCISCGACLAVCPIEGAILPD